MKIFMPPLCEIPRARHTRTRTLRASAREENPMAENTTAFCYLILLRNISDNHGRHFKKNTGVTDARTHAQRAHLSARVYTIHLEINCLPYPL